MLVYGEESEKDIHLAEDFVKCLIALVQKDVWRTTVNIGGVESTSILELAQKIKNLWEVILK